MSYELFRALKTYVFQCPLFDLTFNNILILFSHKFDIIKIYIKSAMNEVKKMKNMKKNRIYITSLIIISLLLSSCSKAPLKVASTAKPAEKTSSTAAYKEQMEPQKPKVKRTPTPAATTKTDAKAATNQTTQTAVSKPKNVIKPVQKPAPAATEKLNPAASSVNNVSIATVDNEKKQEIINESNTVFTANNYDEYYKIVRDGLYNFSDKLTINIKGFTVTDLSVINKVFDNEYEIDYGFSKASGQIYQDNTSTILTLNLYYSLSKDQMVSMRNASIATANTIVSSTLKPGMTDLEKETALHDYIVNLAKYDYTGLTSNNISEASYTDYGIFVKHVAVCEGYAKAFKRVMNAAGLYCNVVCGTGDGSPHAWDIVKVNGIYKMVDITWDDPVTSDGSQILSHEFFNVSDAVMQESGHAWDKNKYPACN